MTPVYEYPVIVLGVVDGDTLDVDTILEDVTVDYGFRIRERRQKFFEQRIRLYGIDTPEHGQKNYAEATAMLRSLVMPVAPAEGFQVYATTAKPHEKYGRWLASIETDVVLVDVRTTDCPSVAQAIIAAHLGVPYFGRKKDEI